MKPINRMRFLSHDSCARCSIDFGVTLVASVVFPDDNDDSVGIQVCGSCVMDSQGVDIVAATSLYVAAANPRRPEQWPLYYGHDGIEGFIKCSRLDNGIVRIGLIRGHAEIWTADEIERFGHPKIQMAYSPNYSLYGAAEMFKPNARHIVETTHFIDLSTPRQLDGPIT